MNPRKPTALKLLANTARRDREPPAIPAHLVLGAVPSAPPWLTDVVALAEFRRLAAVLHAGGSLHAGNLSLLAHVCMLGARLSEMWSTGRMPTASLMTSYRLLLGDLGLTHPVAPTPTGKPNRFRDLAARLRHD